MTFTGGRYCPNVTMGSTKSAGSMRHLRTTGADWVSIVVTHYQWHINSTEIFPLYDGSAVNDVTSGGYYEFITVAEADLRAAIRQARALGFQVLLKPHVDLLRNEHPVGDYWRGDIGGCPDDATPFTSEQWGAWFRSYAEFFLPYAKLAEEEGVGMLSMNCELYCANRQSAHWRALVAATRHVYSGKLTEAAMPPAAGTATGGGKNCAGRTVGGVPPPPYVESIDWYDAVDVVGLDAYWVLNGTTLPEVTHVTGGR